MKNIFKALKDSIITVLFDKHGEVKGTSDILEPDKRRTYNFDGIKVTANLFYKKSGKSAEQVCEDYIVKSTAKQLVNKS